MDWEDPPEFGEPCPTRKGPTGQATRNQHVPAPLVKGSIMTRLGKQHQRNTPSAEKQLEPAPAPGADYQIPLTSAALLRRTQEYRRNIGAELTNRMEAVKRHLCRETAGETDEECALHAEVELLRQALIRLCRE